MRMFAQKFKLFTHGIWRHKVAHATLCCGFAFALVACDDGNLRHVSGYENIAQRIEDCDTSGLAKKIDEIRMSEPRNGASAEIDADALSALYSYISHDCGGAFEHAQMAAARVSACKDSASHEGLRLRAEMCLVMAEALRCQGYADEAYGMADEGRLYASKCGASAELTRLTLLKSKLRRDAHDYLGCLAELRRAEIVVDTASESSLTTQCRMSVLTHAACIAIDMCHISAATRMLAKASDIFDKSPDEKKIDYLCELIRLHIIMGEVGKASTDISRAEMLVKKSGVRGSRGSIDVYLNLIRSRMGDYDKVIARLRNGDFEGYNAEERFVGMMSFAEVMCHEGRIDEAKAVMEDSVRLDDTSLPFLWVIYNDTRLAIAQKDNDFQQSFAIQTQERHRLVSTYNDLFAYDDYRRYAELTAAFEARNTSATAAIKAASDKRLAIAIVALTVICLVLSYLWRRNTSIKRRIIAERVKRGFDNQLAELREQARMLEVTNGRITESIEYAEHIQQAMSPSPEGLNSLPISGSFVFFSPLDVVSGDFFWYMRKGDTLVVCCADCTGHGVPGALMSMISTTILNNVCNELAEDELDPGHILEKMDASIIENLNHNAEQRARDGLDVALIALNLATHELKMASARRPVVFVRNGVLSTVKGTRRSIGDLEPKVRERAFETTTMQMQKDDKIYMYSDGYSDQFGGQNGEKMKSSMVERFLSKICDDDMDQQSLAIQEMFVQWKGDFPQVDDVTFVGLSV